MGSPIALDRCRELWRGGSDALGLRVSEVKWKDGLAMSLDTNDYHNCVLTKQEARLLARDLFIAYYGEQERNMIEAMEKLPLYKIAVERFAACQREALFEAAKAIDEECVGLHIDEEDANHISGRVVGLALVKTDTP